jgi:hypothetical protein
MTKPHHEIRAEAARQALDVHQPDKSDDLETRIKDLITDLGHLCSVEHLNFLATLKSGIRHWAVERIDPNSTLPGPTVEITIDVQGLPDPPKRKPPPKTKPKKVRVPR